MCVRMNIFIHAYVRTYVHMCVFAFIFLQVMVGVSSSFVKSTLLKAGMWWKGKDVDR